MDSLKFANITLKNRLFLAPMVDVSDAAFRLLCRREGAAMAYSEMIYVDAILHENRRTQDLMKIGGKEDRPVGIQVTGNTLEEFKRLSKMEEIRNYDLIDINCGCPSSKIVGNEAGSYLLRTPDKIGDMIKTLKNAGHTVTAKIRLGFSSNNVLEVARKIEKAGADLLTVHARLATQKYRDAPDWSWISKVKRDVGIPVVGNGGVVDGKSASEILEIADGAMIAGAAIGNPFIFREVLRYLRTGNEKEVTKKERVSAFMEYLSLADKLCVLEMARVKYLGGNFLRGFDGASQARMNLMTLKTFGQVNDFVKGL